MTEIKKDSYIDGCNLILMSMEIRKAISLFGENRSLWNVADNLSKMIEERTKKNETSRII